MGTKKRFDSSDFKLYITLVFTLLIISLIFIALISTLATDSFYSSQRLSEEFIVIALSVLIIINGLLIYRMIIIHSKNKKLSNFIFYDKLTELPNASYLISHLNKELKNNLQDNSALMLINYSNFKTINMTFGYEQGDKILQDIAKELQDIIGNQEIICRFSGDRFIVYVEKYDSKEQLEEMAKKICRPFKKPFDINGIKKNLSVQIGIIEIDKEDYVINDLLKNVTISIDYINSNLSCGYIFFDKTMEEKLAREEYIQAELRKIIDTQDTEKLYLGYQPQLELKTNKIIGFEALARMKSKKYGDISAVEFIDIAERQMLIIPIGKMILKMAAEFSSRLNKLGYFDIKIAVNVSGLQLISEDFVSSVLNILRETGMDKSDLELEITESVLLDDFGIINDRLDELSEVGIQIALDDFGTGYSSFFRLGELSIHTLKIDRAFIRRIIKKDYKKLVTSEIIIMAHKLNLQVIAEGVEFEEQKKYLDKYKCDRIQGYLISKPLPSSKAVKILEKYNIYNDDTSNDTFLLSNRKESRKGQA